MTPADYDAWYQSPRGAWIGEAEFRLLRHLLAPVAGERLLDAGCGTGYFSRRFATLGLHVHGVDPDPRMLRYAAARDERVEGYVMGDARQLPFADRAFDHCIAVTSLCFIAEEARAVAELVRVARRGVALGLLNRRSLLYGEKARGGGSGAYRGARWHTAAEARRLFDALPVRDVRVATAVFFHGGGGIARCAERVLPRGLPLGAFLAVVGRIEP
ncbi:MAG: class I SAM-dependent methyltransferase [Pseudomonadota bacterium]